jgi:hypothetical protein
MSSGDIHKSNRLIKVSIRESPAVITERCGGFWRREDLSKNVETEIDAPKSNRLEKT